MWFRLLGNALVSQRIISGGNYERAAKVYENQTYEGTGLKF